MTENLITATPITDPTRWNELLRPLPYAHVLQTWEWGEFKRNTTGWRPERFCFDRRGTTVAAAQVLTRKIGPLRVMYVPKGPALNYANPQILSAALDWLQHLARQRRAVWLKIDPDVVVGTGIPSDKMADKVAQQDNATGSKFIGTLLTRKWRFSKSQVQFRNTITLDLNQPADDILMNMRQSTRRKVRAGPKKGVTIREATLDDIPTLYALYQITGERDSFITRPLDYYRQAWGAFMEAGLAHALIAEYEGHAIAHVILLHLGQKCWYFYGASANEERNRMPNYALQWAAMQWAQEQEYEIYDFWGAPDVFDESDRMWGVYQFKRGFGGAITRHIGAWDYAPYPALYWAYETLMPRILGFMRRSS